MIERKVLAVPYRAAPRTDRQKWTCRVQGCRCRGAFEDPGSRPLCESLCSFPLGGNVTHRKAAEEAGKCETVGTADPQRACFECQGTLLCPPARRELCSLQRSGHQAGDHQTLFAGRPCTLQAPSPASVCVAGGDVRPETASLTVFPLLALAETREGRQVLGAGGGEAGTCVSSLPPPLSCSDFATRASGKFFLRGGSCHIPFQLHNKFFPSDSGQQFDC